MTAHISLSNIYAVFRLDDWNYSEAHEVVNNGDDWIELMVYGRLVAFKVWEVVI